MRIVLVEATAADEKKVFDWRNAHEIRRFSRNSAEISWEDHRRWFAGVLADPHRYLFVAVSDDRDIGVLRLDVEGEVAEVSIYVVPGLQGRGFGAAILEAAVDWAETNLTVSCLTAEVSRTNEASARLFTKAGFALISETDGWLFLRKESGA